MTTLGVELTEQNFDELLPQVDELLKQSKDFTSPTYQLKGLKSINNKFILLKPKQAHFCEVLNFDWQELEILQTDELI